MRSKYHNSVGFRPEPEIFISINVQSDYTPLGVIFIVEFWSKSRYRIENKKKKRPHVIIINIVKPAIRCTLYSYWLRSRMDLKRLI